MPCSAGFETREMKREVWDSAPVAREVQLNAVQPRFESDDQSQTMPAHEMRLCWRKSFHALVEPDGVA